MEITVKYGSIEESRYRLNESEVQQAFIEFIRRVDNLPKTGRWSLEWWSEGGELVAELVRELVKMDTRVTE